MNDPDTPDVVMVNRLANMAVLDTNETVPITHWFGAGGEECPSEFAVSCVAGHDSIGWYAIDLTHFNYAMVH